MKVIVAGSRTITDQARVDAAIANSGFEVTEVVSGRANGVDKLGENWANKRGIPIKPFPANWAQFGRRAGHLRNTDMAAYADALVAVWDGQSSGTSNMIGAARARGLKILVDKPGWD